MLLSNIDPIAVEWIKYFTPMFSVTARAIVLITMLILIRMAYNAASKLIDHISKS